MLLKAAKCQGYSFNRLWVIKGKPTGGAKLQPPPLPLQIRVETYQEEQWIKNAWITTFYCLFVQKKLEN